MKIIIPNFLLVVMMTAATAVAADSSSSSTLATKLTIEEEKSLLDNKERATATTTSTPNGFAASSSTSLSSASSTSSSSSSLVEASGATQKFTSFTGINTDGDDDSTQRKLSKSSKKVKHPEALCTLSLFANSLFMYANQCYDDIMMTISPCDDKDDTCYISERLPSLPQEQEEKEENQEEEQCFVGGSFPAKKNIRYNPSTGDCEFLHTDLTDNPCNLYTGATGTGSLGLKARINVKNNLDVMFIQFTNDKGLTFYNNDDERIAVRSKTHNGRYLRQEGETKPVLSMMPHPFARRRLYSKVSVKNDTPYEVNLITVEYCACTKDENNFIASGGTWTADTYRGGCLVKEIHTTLRLPDGTVRDCLSYQSSGTGFAQFFLMWIDGVCCHRSSDQSNTECTKQASDTYYCDPSEKKYIYNKFCEKQGTKMACANAVWMDGCKACMCFNEGNAAWCDGYRGDYYDNYFKANGVNPWGDTNWRNRKCNTEFLPEEAECNTGWQCAYGLVCPINRCLSI